MHFMNDLGKVACLLHSMRVFAKEPNDNNRGWSESEIATISVNDAFRLVLDSILIIVPQ